MPEEQSTPADLRKKRSDTGPSVMNRSFQDVSAHPLRENKRNSTSFTFGQHQQQNINLDLGTRRISSDENNAVSNSYINVHMGKAAKEVTEEELVSNLSLEDIIGDDKKQFLSPRRGSVVGMSPVGLNPSGLPFDRRNGTIANNPAGAGPGTAMTLDLSRVKKEKKNSYVQSFFRKSHREIPNNKPEKLVTPPSTSSRLDSVGGKKMQEIFADEPDEYDFSQDTSIRMLETIDYGEGCSYDGEVTEGTNGIRLRHGTGMLTYVNGDLFIGTFVRGQRYGRSDCTYNENSPIKNFSGFWKWDVINASRPGKIIFRNGDQYLGQVKAATDDEMVMVNSKNDTLVLEGLPHIKRHGRGEFLGVHIKYYGSFYNDKMEGFGVMVYRTSSTEQQFYGSFKDNQKSGYGVMMYKDGGFFSGLYQNDIRHGEGTLHLSNGDIIEGTWHGDEIKNGVFKKGSIQKTARCTRLLMYEQVKNLEDKNNHYKMHFSHGDHASLPERDLISKHKWKGFFVPFINSIEDEKKRFQESATHYFIEDRKKSITDSNGRLSPISRKSIQDSLQTYLDAQIIQKYPADRLDKIQSPDDEDLYSIGEKGVNVLFSIVSEFVNLFNWRYYGMSKQNTAKEQLPHALDDFYSFLHELYIIVSSILGMDAVAIFGAKPLTYLLKNHVLRRIYNTLFAMYKLCHQEQDNMYRFKLLSLAQVSMHELGVKQKTIPKQYIFSEPFMEAISALQQVTKCMTAHEKFQQLILTNQQLLDVLQEKSVGADELLPIYFYVFIKANLPHVYSEYQFLYDFVDEAVQNSEMGYRFSNFENAVQYVHMLDSNIRDESGVLVPTLVLEDRLCDAIETCMKESRRRDKATQAPRLLWISSLFIVVGNNSNQLSNSTDRKFEIQNRQHINMMNIYFEYAKSIVSSVGLKLCRHAQVQQMVDQDDGEINAEQWTDVEPKKWKSPNSDDEFGVYSDSFVYTITFEQLFPSYVYYRLASKIEEVIDQKERT